jgi:hypothetical protein
LSNFNNPPADPYFDPYVTLNLDDDFYRLFKIHIEALKLADQIVEIVRTGMVAAIPILLLDEMGLEIAMEAALSHVYVQCKKHYWWSSICLCMMSRCSMEEFHEDGVVRFSQTRYDGEALYRDNVEWVKVKDTKRLTLQAKKPQEKLPDQPVQISLF